jgi:hypothetical protein
MFDVNGPANPVGSPPLVSVCEFRAIARHIAGNTTLSGLAVQLHHCAPDRHCPDSLHLR